VLLFGFDFIVLIVLSVFVLDDILGFYIPGYSHFWLFVESVCTYILVSSGMWM